MRTIALFGAGKIGIVIAGLFGRSGRYKVKVCDIDPRRAEAVAAMWPNCTSEPLALNDEVATLKLLEGCNAVLSALPFHCNIEVAQFAKKAAVHYFDLTEDVRTTKEIMKLAEGAKTAFMPQCGLAPGFISIAAAHLASRFEVVDSLKMRVGALPIYPSNKLKYNLTWSTEGLINEYGNACEAVIDGKLCEVAALDGYERFMIDGAEYEAFNTSGGLGTLADTLHGKVRTLDYKSIRFTGHRDLMAFLMHDLGFNHNRDLLKQIFEQHIPSTTQDKCIIFVEVQGKRAGRFIQESYASTIYHQQLGTLPVGAIQITTAAGICAPVDLLLSGRLPRSQGFVRTEEITLPELLSNEFGKYYQDEDALSEYT